MDGENSLRMSNEHLLGYIKHHTTGDKNMLSQISSVELAEIFTPRCISVPGDVTQTKNAGKSQEYYYALL